MTLSELSNYSTNSGIYILRRAALLCMITTPYPPTLEEYKNTYLCIVLSPSLQVGGQVLPASRAVCVHAVLCRLVVQQKWAMDRQLVYMYVAT